MVLKVITDVFYHKYLKEKRINVTGSKFNPILSEVLQGRYILSTLSKRRASFHAVWHVFQFCTLEYDVNFISRVYAGWQVHASLYCNPAHQ